MPHDQAERPNLDSGAPSSASQSAAAPVTGTAPTGGTYFLGRYRVVDEIGIGGMASVHLARMDGPGGFQKWVAIKKIHPHLVEDESFVQMFLDEARVAARISHPNVATVFDLGKHEETYWIAMEYLHGEPLREVMRRTEELGTAMPPEIACRVIADAAEGLHAAHELNGKNGEKLGLVHRDVTPHNLFVTYDGVTKVVDFGIAKFTSRMSVTRAGTLKGKLAYMSPEQVHGEGIDRRTDIFALGVVLWELTTGQRLFRMENDLDTLAKVQECNVPRPSTLIRGYPVDLEKIVMKALAKNRGERFPTARELSRALQSLLMRRGLFIASDEVAAYTQSIFQDRIQKRDAHLRWASEVTQTIDLEQMLLKPKIATDYTSSEVQAAQSNAVSTARPAALATPPVAMQPPAEQRATGPSVATAPRPPSAPPPVNRITMKPPRPAAGMPPPSPLPAPPRPTIPDEDERHPADDEGPTIQGGPPDMTDGMDMQEVPTLMANPIVRAGQPIPSRQREDEFDQTVVAPPREPYGGPPAPPSFAAQSLHQGFPNAPMAQQFPPPAPMSVPTPFGPSPGFGMSQPYPAPPASGELPFGDPPPPPPSPMMGMGMAPQDSGDFSGRLMPMPPGDMFARSPYPLPDADFGQPPVAGAYPRTPGVDNRTVAAQRFRRRPPMWVVTALSCSIALLIAGIVIAVLSSTAPPKPTAMPVPGSGPLSAARTAFEAVVSGPASSTLLTPPPVAGTTPEPPPPAPTTIAPATTASVTAAAAVNTAPPAPTTPPAPTHVSPTPPPAPAPTPRAATPVAAQPAPAPAPVVTPSTKKGGGLGALTVVCIPKCDQIVDNGTSLGPGHIFNRPVPSGKHALSLSAPNGVKKDVVVEVVADQTREVRMSMDK